MKQVIAGVLAAVLVSVSTRVWGQEPVAVEAGAVIGVLGVPYGSVSVVKGPWTARFSGVVLPWVDDCFGLQINAGRVVRAVGDARHTIGVVWGGFQTRCAYDPDDPNWQQAANINGRRGGQFAGVTYTFQVRGFFVEAGPGVGSPNPAAPNTWLLSRIYGQVGYVTRLGKND